SALEVMVENPRDPDAPPRRGHGLGLKNVRQRLETLDPQHARVDVFGEPERFRVQLTLPAVEAGGAAADAQGPAPAPAEPGPPVPAGAPAAPPAPPIPQAPAPAAPH